MLKRTRDFVDVAARSRELGCRVPVRAALLPGNFPTATYPDEFCYHAATPHVRSAWLSVGLVDEGPDQARDMTQSSSIGIVSQADMNAERAKVPLVVFLGASLSNGSEWRVAIALGMISSVIASDSRCASPRDVRLDVVVERPDDRGCACIEYQGDAFGIVALVRDVRRVWAGS